MLSFSLPGTPVGYHLDGLDQVRGDGVLRLTKSSAGFFRMAETRI